MTIRPPRDDGHKKGRDKVPAVATGAAPAAPPPAVADSSSATPMSPAPEKPMPDDITIFARYEVPISERLGPRRQEKTILMVEPPRPDPDGVVASALRATTRSYAKNGEERTDREVKSIEEVVTDLLQKRGATEDIAKLTARLDAGGLDRNDRLLLSQPPIYASLVKKAIDLGDRLKLDDTAGLAAFIRRGLTASDGPRTAFISELVDTVLKNSGIVLDEVTEAAVKRGVATLELPLQGDKARETVLAVVKSQRENGVFAQAIRQFLRREHPEVDPDLLTAKVQRAMIDHLKKLGVKFKLERIKDGIYDEYLAVAYYHALQRADGASADPIDAIRTKGVIPDWDFTVDTFDTVEEQGVIPENILAAGALDYIWNLGERLGMYRLADTMVLHWGSGALDVATGEAAAKLYRYWKLRSERIDPEERAMLYRRVLNKGNAKLLSGMVGNELFPELWGTLMAKVAEFIQRTEEKKSEERSVSRQPIYQATKQLQFNLTEFMTGAAPTQVRELHSQLQEAKAILEDPEIVDYFGSGRRKTIWTVIERASKEWFGQAPNISAIRTAAVDGNKVFQWIAAFDQATVTDQQFYEFKDAAEAWILAQAIDGSEPGEPPSESEEDESDEETEQDDFDADWDK